ncbi:MAG: homoserine dehydrogenase [Burkholderiaceae bacterium]|nr:homoserine dehydrogenase [Burkholderiaceae bacterium]
MATSEKELSGAVSVKTAKRVSVGLIGFGTVGTGVVRVLKENASVIKDKLGCELVLKRVADRDTVRDRGVKLEEGVLTGDAMDVISDPEISIVIELVGGTGVAREFIMKALEAGKHVVTANKALLAEHGGAIFAAARQHGVAVAYEGAVAVSIPIIKALREGLTANRIEWVAGIINGTTNFILSQMRDAGLDFAQALAQAQALGYAEANPAFDIEGIDAAHKLALLAANAFGMPVNFADVQVQGITTLRQLDVACAEQLGYRIKLLAVARRREGGIELRVQPALLPATHLMAQVNGSMNGILVQGDASGVTMYYGAGAGAEQTASAVIADLVDVARLDGTHAGQRVPHLGFQAHALHPLPVLPHAAVCTRHHLRVPVHSRQDMVAVGALLARQAVPVERLEWMADHPDEAHQVLVQTGEAPQGAIDLALHVLQALPEVAGPCVQWRVELLEG